MLPLEGLEVLEASSAPEALAMLEGGSSDLVLLESASSLLLRMRAEGIATPAVVIGPSTAVHDVRDAMRAGAQDYLFLEELSTEVLGRIISGFRDRIDLQEQLRRHRYVADPETPLIGRSVLMARVRSLVTRLSNASTPVLIRGETGVGKELVARALHVEGGRGASAFVPVNCTALPSNLVESLLFGHERGVFTGAERRTKGYFELAAGGTLLLDEIADMPLDAQGKLLRVLEDRRYRPLGAERERAVECRVLASTHVDLEERVRQGLFRDDLFFRLNVVSISVPSLEERREDIPELVAHFVTRASRPVRLTDDAVLHLAERAWPGNVRELKNLIERTSLLAEQPVVDARALLAFTEPPMPGPGVEIDKLALSILALPGRRGSKLDAIERSVLHHAIESCGGNKSAAARLLGVGRKVLERRWDRLTEPAPSDEPDEAAAKRPDEG